jgi:hypothetical protein
MDVCRKNNRRRIVLACVTKAWCNTLPMGFTGGQESLFYRLKQVRDPCSASTYSDYAEKWSVSICNQELGNSLKNSSTPGRIQTTKSLEHSLGCKDSIGTGIPLGAATI